MKHYNIELLCLELVPIWDSHSSGYEEFYLLHYTAMQSI
jgi:hypothetical protein